MAQHGSTWLNMAQPVLDQWSSPTTNLSVTTKVVRTSAKRTEVHVPFATEGSERLQIAPSAPLVELSLAIPILLRWMVDVTQCCSRETFCSGAFQVGYDLGYDLDVSVFHTGLRKASKPVVSQLGCAAQVWMRKFQGRLDLEGRANFWEWWRVAQGKQVERGWESKTSALTSWLMKFQQIQQIQFRISEI